MSEDATKQVHELVNAFDRSKAQQTFATLIPLPGDFDAAKAVLHDAFAVAKEHWALHGVPAS